MSSDLFVCDGSLRFSHSTLEIEIPSDADLQFFYDDTFSPFSDSAIDIFQELSHHLNRANPADEATQLENLNLDQNTQMQNLEICSKLTGGFESFQDELSVLDVKNEAFVNPHNHGGGSENVAYWLQRNFNNNSLIETDSHNNFHSIQAIESRDENNNPFSGHMRRGFSTGDLQSFPTCRTTSNRPFSSSLATESSLMEEAASFKAACRYSAEERRERISKYRAKRTHRNFNKTIKYTCRKTLADNRPRIRGRFARYDEPSCESPKAACSVREEGDIEDDEIWLERLHGGRGGAAIGRRW